jgi:hypothetical protein
VFSLSDPSATPTRATSLVGMSYVQYIQLDAEDGMPWSALRAVGLLAIRLWAPRGAKFGRRLPLAPRPGRCRARRLLRVRADASSGPMRRALLAPPTLVANDPLVIFRCHQPISLSQLGNTAATTAGPTCRRPGPGLSADPGATVDFPAAPHLQSNPASDLVETARDRIPD